MNSKSFLFDNNTSGNAGRIQDSAAETQRKQILETWERLEFLEGLKDEHLKSNIAQLYENMAQRLIRESTATDSSGSFETIAFPLIRRTFQKLLANKIVTIYALNYPVGRLFFYRPLISTRATSGVDRNHRVPQGAYTNEPAFNPDGTSNQQVTFNQTNLYDALYATSYSEFGDGLFDASKPNFTVRTTVLSPVGAGTTVGANDFKIRAFVTGLSINERGKLIGPSGSESDTEEFLAGLRIINSGTALTSVDGTSSIAANTGEMRWNHVLPPYGSSIVDSQGRLQVELDLTGPISGGGYGLLTGASGRNISSFVAQWRDYHINEIDAEMAEVTFDITDVTVAVGDARKLRAQWTPEVAMDVQRFQNIDAEKELTNLLSETIAQEIDMEILRDLNRIATWVARFDVNGYTRQNSPQYFGTQKDWYQFMMERINQIDAQIFKSTLDEGSSWLVTSSEVSALFNNFDYFHADDAKTGRMKFSAGIERVGNLNSRYDVYQNAYFPAGAVLVGRKGDNPMRTGYVYCPYQPIVLTPVMVDHRNFANIRGLMTRYAKKAINARYYGKLWVDGLSTFATDLLR